MSRDRMAWAGTRNAKALAWNSGSLQVERRVGERWEIAGRTGVGVEQREVTEAQAGVPLVPRMGLGLLSLRETHSSH